MAKARSKIKKARNVSDYFFLVADFLAGDLPEVLLEALELCEPESWT